MLSDKADAPCRAGAIRRAAIAMERLAEQQGAQAEAAAKENDVAHTQRRRVSQAPSAAKAGLKKAAEAMVQKGDLAGVLGMALKNPAAVKGLLTVMKGGKTHTVRARVPLSRKTVREQ